MGSSLEELAQRVEQEVEVLRLQVSNRLYATLTLLEILTVAGSLRSSATSYGTTDGVQTRYA